MYLISTQGHTNVNVHHLRIRKTGEIWVSMKDIGNGLGVTNIYDELNTKSNKFVYVKNNIMTNIIKQCRGEKKEE